jgi:hypothetical protein
MVTQHVLRVLLSGLIDWMIAALFVAGGLGQRRRTSPRGPRSPCRLRPPLSTFARGLAPLDEYLDPVDTFWTSLENTSRQAWFAPPIPAAGSRVGAVRRMMVRRS